MTVILTTIIPMFVTITTANDNNNVICDNSHEDIHDSGHKNDDAHIGDHQRFSIASREGGV